MLSVEGDFGGQASEEQQCLGLFLSM